MSSSTLPRDLPTATPSRRYVFDRDCDHYTHGMAHTTTHSQHHTYAGRTHRRMQTPRSQPCATHSTCDHHATHEYTPLRATHQITITVVILISYRKTSWSVLPNPTGKSCTGEWMQVCHAWCWLGEQNNGTKTQSTWGNAAYKKIKKNSEQTKAHWGGGSKLTT